jgi:hypothetical protein
MKVQTDASVTIRLLIPTPTQRVSPIGAETDVLTKTVHVGCTLCPWCVVLNLLSAPVGAQELYPSKPDLVKLGRVASLSRPAATPPAWSVTRCHAPPAPPAVG